VAALGSDRLIVGADLGDAGVIDAGAAHLFTTNGTLLTTFTNPAPEAGDLFGCAVSGVGADKVVIGAYRDETFADDAGGAYLFGKDGDTLEVFFPPSPASGDGFGVAVAAAGTDKVVIGSLADAAYLFSTNGALLTTFTNPAPGGSDLFGVTVAAVGDDRVLIGAPYWDSPGLTNAGAAYLFGTDGSLLATYTSPSPAAGDYFGSAVSAKGTNTLVIGAQWENTGAPDAGAVYVFSADGTLRSTLINPTPASADAFGSAVAALSAEWVAVGTPLDDTGAENAGAAYIFGLNESFTPGLVAAGVVSGSIGTVELAAAAVTAEKVSALDAGSVTTGMLADERLSSNVALLDASQTFTGSNIFNAVAGSFSGDGSGLAALDASQLTSGILPDARLSTNVALVTDVDQLVDAAVATQISTNVAELDANQTFTGVNIFDNDVGIGTATPELKLDVRGGILSQVGNGNDDNLIVKKPGALSPSNARFVFSHRTTGDELWLYGYDGTTFKNLQGWNHADNTARLPANGDTLFVDMTAGRVGVGTSTPSTTLHVNGTITGDGSGLTALNASALGSGTVGSARISGSYNNSVSMGNTANVFSGRFQGNPTAPASAPSFTWVGDTDSGLFRSGANTVALATGGAERMRITSSGDVGIGTTLPEGDLHVRGGSSPGSLIVTPGVPDSDAQLLLAENTSASLGGILRYDGSANQVQILGWESDVATAPHVVVGRANGNVGLGTGANSVDARLHVQANNARVAKFDRYDTDGQLVAWARNDNVVGDVVVLAGNVTYNAFTGSHYAWCEQAPRPGALMSMTGDNRPLRAEGNSEVVYGVEPSGRANDPACLGAYMGTSAVDEQSVRLIAAVGNGEMWVVDTGPDIRPGDLLISSTIPGCARLDDPDEFAVGHVVARAAERVHWDTVQVGTDGIKRTKISVLYGPFTRGSRGTLAQTGARASDREIAALRRENRDLHQRLSAIEAMLGRTRLASASAATDQGGAR
jgi:hypothetical protein